MDALSIITRGILGGGEGGGECTPYLIAILPNPEQAYVGDIILMYAVFNVAAIEESIVYLSSDDESIVIVPESVTLSSGDVFAEFSAEIIGTGTTKINGQYDTVEVDADISVLPRLSRELFCNFDVKIETLVDFDVDVSLL